MAEGLVALLGRPALLRRHHNAQRLLRSLKVVIPYADHLGFPAERARHRRDHAKFLNLLRTITFAHQHRKEVKTFTDGSRSVEYVEADLGDYALAYDLAPGLFGPTLDELDHRTRGMLLRLWTWAGEEFTGSHPQLDVGDPTGDDRRSVTFTRRQAATAAGIDGRAAARFVDALADAECLVVIAGKQGQAYRYRLDVDDPARPTLSELVTPPELEHLIGEGR